MKQQLVICKCGLTARTSQEEYFCPRCHDHIVYPKDKDQIKCTSCGVSGARKEVPLSVG